MVHNEKFWTPGLSAMGLSPSSLPKLTWAYTEDSLALGLTEYTLPE